MFRSLLTLVLVFCSSSCLAGELIQVPAALQISSKVSDGKYTIPEIIRICRNNKFKVVVICDRDLMRWEYGIMPWRNIIKRTEETGSILKYGARRYLKEFKQVKEDNPDLVIIPGVESAPFYYWNGGLSHSDFEIRDWHKHLIAIGLKEPRDIEYLPVIGNKKALELPFGFNNLILFWPVLLLAVGIFYFEKRSYDYKDQSGKQLAGFSKSSRRLGILLIAAAGIFLADNFPFRFYRFDQYHGQQGEYPYQNYINYVRGRQGLVFWAHPEARNEEKIGAVSVKTEDHSIDLLRSHDYTGFGVFFEGFKNVGKINGIWDSLLKDYCSGLRQNPVWASGFLSFDYSGDLDEYLRDLKVVLLLPELNEEEVLKALKTGSAYSVMGRGSSRFTLDKFTVSDSDSGERSAMGGTLRANATPRIEIKADYLSGQPGQINIKLIRNGELIKDFVSATPADITYLDEQAPLSGKFYYRLEIKGADVVVVTNPVFVTRNIEK
jgi:hypothetical protein